jgi:4-hydroxythreonine-4-phosphate dehydrogenase
MAAAMQRCSGQPDERTGAAQVGYLEAAVAAAQRGELGAIATAPISKTWARRAGFAFPGHTEMLASRLGARDVVMLFVGPRLKVALATVHVALADVARTLTTAGLRTTIELVAKRSFATSDRRAADQRRRAESHAGEGGLLGGEERDIIAPAIAPCGAAIVADRSSRRGV